MKKAFRLLLFLLYTLPLRAEETTASSRIFAVTVFPDRADVSRKAEIPVPAGKHTIVFNGLPAGLMMDSLRVSGKGSAGFKIGSVETKQIFTSEPAVADEKSIQDKLSALRDQRRFIEAQIKAADTGKAFLEGLTKAPFVSAQPTGRNAPAFSPAIWQEGWRTIQNGMNDLGKEVIEKQIKIRTIDNEISALNNQLRKISTGRKSYKQVRVNIEAPSALKAELTIQYQIAGASWKPLYEARLNSEKQTVHIVQYGNIAQKTGEDWNNVSLTLSTARPSVTMQPPVLSPIWLNLKNNVPVIRHKSLRSAALKADMTNFAVQSDTLTTDKEMTLGMESFDAKTVSAETVGTEFSGVFAIGGTANVPADGADYRFNIGDYTNTAEISAEIFPEVDPSAYLIATTVFNGSLPLLPGKIALFRDGAFIGNSDLDLLRPNEKLHLALGQDEKIRSVYTPMGGETTDGGMISRETRKNVLSRTDVQNLHNRPLKIAVYEQIPVSRNSDISVKIIKDKTTPDYETEPDNKVGLIRWESVYRPKEKKEILFGYSVGWPKEKILTGL